MTAIKARCRTKLLQVGYKTPPALFMSKRTKKYGGFKRMCLGGIADFYGYL